MLNRTAINSAAGLLELIEREARWKERSNFSSSSHPLTTVDIEDHYGAATGISEDGRTCLITSPRDDDMGDGAGAIYVFTIENGGWSEPVKLHPSITKPYDFLGGHNSTRMANNGDRFICGVPEKYPNTPLDGRGVYWYSGESLGALCVFDRSEGVWSETQIIRSSDGVNGDVFGFHADISTDGNTIVSSSPYKDGAVAGDWAGAVYMYDWNASSLQFDNEQMLQPADKSTGMHFGFQVSIDGAGETIAVSTDHQKLWKPWRTVTYTIVDVVTGAPNVGYFAIAGDLSGSFLRGRGPITVNGSTGNNGTWGINNNNSSFDGTNTRIYVTSDITNATVDGTIDGPEVFSDSVGTEAVYIYTKVAGVWTEQQKILGDPTDGRFGSMQFGVNLDLSKDGNTLIIGSFFGTPPNSGAASSGAVYVYTRSGNTFVLQQIVNPSITTSNAGWGNVLSLSNDGSRFSSAAFNEKWIWNDYLQNEITTGADVSGSLHDTYININILGGNTKTLRIHTDATAGNFTLNTADEVQVGFQSTNVTAEAMAVLLQTAIDSLTGISASVSGNIVTTTQGIKGSVSKAATGSSGFAIKELIPADNGDPIAHPSGPPIGAVYVFKKVADSGDAMYVEEARMINDDWAVGQRIGIRNSISGNGKIVIAGSPFHNSEDASQIDVNDSGAFYIFDRLP